MDDTKKTVFISHSSKDEHAVKLVYEALEQNEFSCWVSGRDIPPHADWADSITRGLEDAKLVVLVLSENSINSNEVLKELTLASQMKMPVIPFRIDEVRPHGPFRFHLSIEQWVPAANPPDERHLQSLVGTVDRCLLDLNRSWWEPTSESIWYRRGWKRTVAILGAAAVMAAAIAALGIFGVPYLRDRLDGQRDGESSRPLAPREVAIADTTATDTILASDQDTVAVQDDTPPVTEPPTVVPVDTRGTVTLTTHPSGARVSLNGRSFGSTPVRDRKLEAGSYTARFQLAGYRTESRAVEIRPGAAATVDVTMSRQLTSLEVTSIPNSAEVVLDGARIGTTPHTFEGLTSGRHVVVVTKDGYSTRRDTVTLRAGRPFQHEARLDQLVGHLTITVIPSGSIAINGDPKAVDSNVPFPAALRPGEYEIEARHVIYGSWRKTVQVADGDDKRLDFDFSQEFDIVVTSNPANAAIYVNDNFRGCYTPYMISVRPGLRRIDVRLDGYRSRAPQEITVEEGVEGRVHFDMQRSR